MKILRPELVTPGYIFMAPYRNRDPGPYIYDNFGVRFRMNLSARW